MTEGSRFAGKVALVTAAASGIGAETARTFARNGASVVLADVMADAGRALAADLAAQGFAASFVECDASTDAGCAAMVAHAVDSFGGLDIALNIVGNLGGGTHPTDLLHEEPLEGYVRTVELNLHSAFLGMKHQIAQMLEQGRGGAICNTASMAGLRFTPEGPASYSAAKAAVVRLSEVAAVQYARHDIRVNVIAPGLTVTHAVAQHFGEAKIMEMVNRTQPMGRAMTPADMAQAYLWLCSPEAGGVTGHTIPVAGGWAAT